MGRRYVRDGDGVEVVAGHAHNALAAERQQDVLLDSLAEIETGIREISFNFGGLLLDIYP